MNMNMTETVKPLVDNIVHLRQCLERIENKYNSCYTLKEKIKLRDQRTDIKLERLKRIQDKRLKINAGGTFFETSTEIIMNCRFDNILKDKVVMAIGQCSCEKVNQCVCEQDHNQNQNEIEDQNQNEDEDALFVDFDASKFEVLLDIMRLFQNEKEEDQMISQLFELEKMNQIDSNNDNTNKDNPNKDNTHKDNTHKDFKKANANIVVEEDKVFRIYTTTDTYTDDNNYNIDNEALLSQLVESIKLFFYKDGDTILDLIKIKGWKSKSKI